MTGRCKKKRRFVSDQDHSASNKIRCSNKSGVRREPWNSINKMHFASKQGEKKGGNHE